MKEVEIEINNNYFIDMLKISATIIYFVDNLNENLLEQTNKSKKAYKNINDFSGAVFNFYGFVLHTIYHEGMTVVEFYDEFVDTFKKLVFEDYSWINIDNLKIIARNIDEDNIFDKVIELDISLNEKAIVVEDIFSHRALLHNKLPNYFNKSTYVKMIETIEKKYFNNISKKGFDFMEYINCFCDYFENMVTKDNVLFSLLKKEELNVDNLTEEDILFISNYIVYDIIERYIDCKFDTYISDRMGYSKKRVREIYDKLYE